MFDTRSGWSPSLQDPKTLQTWLVGANKKIGELKSSRSARPPPPRRRRPARGSSRLAGACDRRRSTRVPSDRPPGRQAESRARHRRVDRFRQQHHIPVRTVAGVPQFAGRGGVGSMYRCTRRPRRSRGPHRDTHNSNSASAGAVAIGFQGELDTVVFIQMIYTNYSSSN